MKTVSEYYQNWAQDTSRVKTPIDFSESFCLIKLSINNEILWMIAGKAKQDESLNGGFIKNGNYYEIISQTQQSLPSLYKQLKSGEWFKTAISTTKALSYEIIENQKVRNEYVFSVKKQQLVLSYRILGSNTTIAPDTSRVYFQLASNLNRGSFLPGKYADLKEITDKLQGFALNYYGAKYVDSEVKGTYLDPDFDLILNFSKRTRLSELTKLLRKVAKEDVRIESDWIYLNRARYRFKAINDSTIFIGKNNPKIQQEKASFTMKGKPWVLTEIKDLGWKSGILELIPEYRALKDFSESVSSVHMKTTCSNNPDFQGTSTKGKCVKNIKQVVISFKPDVNARLETFRVLLTMANAYQFE